MPDRPRVGLYVKLIWDMEGERRMLLNKAEAKGRELPKKEEPAKEEAKK